MPDQVKTRNSESQIFRLKVNEEDSLQRLDQYLNNKINRPLAFVPMCLDPLHHGHINIIRNSIIGSKDIPFVEIAHPITGGKAPDAPPITIF